MLSSLYNSAVSAVSSLIYSDVPPPVQETSEATTASDTVTASGEDSETQLIDVNYPEQREDLIEAARKLGKALSELTEQIYLTSKDQAFEEVRHLPSDGIRVLHFTKDASPAPCPSVEIPIRFVSDLSDSDGSTTDFADIMENEDGFDPEDGEPLDLPETSTLADLAFRSHPQLGEIEIFRSHSEEEQVEAECEEAATEDDTQMMHLDDAYGIELNEYTEYLRAPVQPLLTSSAPDIPHHILESEEVEEQEKIEKENEDDEEEVEKEIKNEVEDNKEEDMEEAVSAEFVLNLTYDIPAVQWLHNVEIPIRFERSEEPKGSEDNDENLQIITRPFTIEIPIRFVSDEEKEADQELEVEQEQEPEPDATSHVSKCYDDKCSMDGAHIYTELHFKLACIPTGVAEACVSEINDDDWS